MKSLVVCRCEEVSLEDISNAVRDGAKTSKEIKLRTRAGMGICQGKTCRPLLDQLIVKCSDQKLPPNPSLSLNFPIRPITFDELTKERKPGK